jgi:glycosyltransferase involved in cell wall biosynthesis
MKIAFTFEGFTQKYGGVSLYFSRLAIELRKLGENVRIYAPISRNKNLKILPKECVRGLQIPNFPPKSGRVIKAINEVVSQRGISSWLPDVLHETYYSERGGNHSRAPKIVTVYDMIHELFPEYFDSSDKTREIKKKSIDSADRIITISEKTKNDLRLIYDIPEEKITCIYLGVDRPLLDLCPSSIGKVRPYILYVGSRVGYKNFIGMISGVALSKELQEQFDIVAIGGGKFSLSELREIKRLGFRENQVRQLDIGILDLGSYYSNASIFVYPSIYEGFGLPPLEAMSYNCPVVASNGGSIPEILQNAAVFFDPLDQEQIAHSIESIVFSTENSSNLRHQGLICSNLYTWKSCAEKTLDVYKSAR